MATKKNWRKQEAVGPFVVLCQHKLTGIKSYHAIGGGLLENVDDAREYPTVQCAEFYVKNQFGALSTKEHDFTILPHPQRSRYPEPVARVVKQLTDADLPILDVFVSTNPEMHDHEIAVWTRQFVQVPVDGSTPSYTERAADSNEKFLFIFEPPDLVAVIKDRLPKEAQ